MRKLCQKKLLQKHGQVKNSIPFPSVYCYQGDIFLTWFIKQCSVFYFQNDIFLTWFIRDHVLFIIVKVTFSLPGSSDTMFCFPLSFHADTHQSVGSAFRMGYVALKYSKKSGEKSRSSEIHNRNAFTNQG